MKLSEFSFAALQQRIKTGLFIHIGPFFFRLHSNLSPITNQLQLLYAHYQITDDHRFADFHVRLYKPINLHRFWHPQVQFQVDREKPFSPFPADTALPFLEWGLNWCIATRAHQYLMLHAGALEKNGKTLLLPALPGSGKSTLSAALEHRGWRLFSDEFALIRPEDYSVIPFPRLIPLKNESIAVIRDFADDAVLGPEFPKTRKGTVAHLRPTLRSVDESEKPGKVRWIIFPTFEKGASLTLKTFEKDRAFLKLSENSFNYELLGLRGFETASQLIESSHCYLFRYGNLEEAVAQLNRLADDD